MTGGHNPGPMVGVTEAANWAFGEKRAPSVGEKSQAAWDFEPFCYDFQRESAVGHPMDLAR